MTDLDALDDGEARIIDARADENSGPPDQRIEVIAQRARDAASLAAVPRPAPRRAA
jgi:hypothetical protein